MDLFDLAFASPVEDIEFELRGFSRVPWSHFVLNPRRLRGSDFLMRWSQGVWSEERLIQAVNETKNYFALPYGPSGTAPDDDPRAFELYFERLEKAGLGQLKRPDLVVFRRSQAKAVMDIVEQLGGNQELPFIPEDDPRVGKLLSLAILAVECENSLWRASQMPDYGSELKPQRWLGGELGLKRSAVLPTVIVKEEDRVPLKSWQQQRHVGIHIWHVFYDMAFGLALDTAESLIEQGKIVPTKQVFQAPGGATTAKTIYKFYYHYAYPVGKSGDEPTLVAAHITDKNGHILPYVRFDGGSLKLSREALEVLDEASGGKG
ncbi:MAG: AccI family restriction endonuclease [Chloroflexi bacterium]|nr:AccI family restriction endonuclease [Chloroflexota bacterium]